MAILAMREAFKEAFATYKKDKLLETAALYRRKSISATEATLSDRGTADGLSANK
jgi:hypothetical protein